MSQTLKKIFSSFVSLVTILWSVGAGTLALPNVASAATLVAGDLIKASGPTVYYYAGDGKRYVFPNETTYFSWYTGFSSVKTITDAELAAVTISGNVTIRPGTKLVKITTDPKVYAVTKGGALHWVESEAIATALYGSAWASRVVDVPDMLFVNYTVGTSVASSVHPDGTLVTYAGSPDKFVVWGGMKRKLSDASLAANTYNTANVITTTIAYTAGTDVTVYEADLGATVIAVGGTVTPPTSGGSVTVALAADTPAGMTVPMNTNSVQLARFTLTAGAAAARVTGVKLHRFGVGAAGNFSNVYLYNADGVRLTSGRTVNSTTNLVEYNGLAIDIAANGTYTLVVQGDFAASSSGGQHAFELVDMAALTVANSGTAGGSFPVRGNVFTVGNASAARVDVQKGTTPTNPNIGAIDAEVSNFKLIANTNDVEVRRVTLTQAGSVTNSDLSDLKLYQGTTLVASAAALVGDKVVFNFSPAYTISQGTTKIFSVKSRVGGRASRTITTYVEYTTDVYAVDKIYNSGALICINTTATGCASSGGNFDGSGTNLITVTTQGGTLTISFNGPSAQNVARAAQDYPLFRFSLVSPDNTLEIKNMDFTLRGDNANSWIRGSAGTDYFRDIKVKDLDTGETLMGPISLPSTLTSISNSGVMTISNAFNVEAGKVRNLAITVDIANSEDVANQFYGSGTSSYNILFADSTPVLFGATDVRIVSTGEYLAQAKIVPNTALTGNSMTVKSAQLSVALASSPVSTTVVKKQQNVPTTGLVFTAGAQSDILVTSLILTGTASTTAAYAVGNLKDVVTRCGLYNGATLVGIAQAPDTTAGTMNITNMNFRVTKGTSQTLLVKCETDSTIANSVGDIYNIGIATAATDVTAQDGDGNTVTATLSTGVTTNAASTSPAVVITVRNAGTMTITTDSLRQSTILVGGTDVWQNFAQFRATAQLENVEIDLMTVTSTGLAANFTNIAIAQDGAVKGSAQLPAGAHTFKDIDLAGNKMVVPKDNSVIFQVWGKLATINPSSTVSGNTSVARTGNTMALGLAGRITSNEWNSNYNDKFNVRAVGQASGERIYATSTDMSGGTNGNSFVLRRSKPTVTRQALSSTTLTSGQDMDMYKFQVSADSAGSVAVKKFVFNFSKSTTTNSTISLANFRLRRGSTDLASADYSIVDTNGADLKAGTWQNGSSTGQLVVYLTSEDVISGSGNVYTVHATIGGLVQSGDSVSLSFNRTGGSTVVTGFLTTNYVTSTGGVVGPSIDTSVNPDNSADAAGTFVWSDMSELPHSSAAGNNSGSRDWSDDVYVEDLTATQVVAR